MSERKKRLGRPPNEALYERVIKELQRQPRTVQELADFLGMPKRTTYRYIELAMKAGVPVIKLGMTRDAPYSVMKSKPKTKK